jgi:hypothetical protein
VVWFRLYLFHAAPQLPLTPLALAVNAFRAASKASTDFGHPFAMPLSLY